MSTYERSKAAFSRAKRVIAGGVNSPVRAFKSVGGSPIFIKSAEGATLTDIDGNTYIDYVMSWGPLILGHAYPAVIDAIVSTAARGTSYGAPTEIESELAELVCSMVPSIERLRFVSSGTEATMSALRLARGFTGRERVIKFAGCYHGHADSFLIAAGSGALTNGQPDSPGVTRGAAQDTIVVEYNDLDAVSTAFTEYPDTIAAVIIEPYAGNMGLVLPQPGFLAGLRELTSKHGALLIFDEVMTGFRVARGGAQALEDMTPDLTTLGKIIGGGMPVGAFGGRAEIMAKLSPEGPVYQAGTLSGNPLAMCAGLATLGALHDERVYDRLEASAHRLSDGLRTVMRKHGVPHYSTRAGSMLCAFFAPGPIHNLTDAKRSNTKLYAHFFHAMLERGVYLAPSQFETGFVSAAHTDTQIDNTIAAADEALAAVMANVA